MQGRTYRYFSGAPLYPFGFGLSYTKFAYTNLKLLRTRIRAGDNLTVSVDVQNVGNRAGDEVVQLYLKDVVASVPVPIRSLAGVKRIFLRPGERQRVSFTLTASQMSLIDDAGKRKIEPGEFLLSVGGKQPGFSGSQDAASTSVVTARLIVIGRTRGARPRDTTSSLITPASL
jgi:beta-glucosidase